MPHFQAKLPRLACASAVHSRLGASAFFHLLGVGAEIARRFRAPQISEQQPFNLPNPESAGKIIYSSSLLGASHCWERRCKRWLQAGGSVSEKFSYQRNFLTSHSETRGGVFHPYTSLRPAPLNHFPINKTAGRGQDDFMGRAQPFADCLFGKKMCGKRWGLLCPAFLTRKIK